MQLFEDLQRNVKQAVSRFFFSRINCGYSLESPRKICSNGEIKLHFRFNTFNLILYVPVQFSSYVGTDHPVLKPFLALLNGSCSRTQHSDAGEARTGGPSVKHTNTEQLRSLLLLPVYWYAINYEDYHPWSARREMVVEVTKKMR